MASMFHEHESDGAEDRIDPHAVHVRILICIAAAMLLIYCFCPYRLGITIGRSMSPELKPNQPFIIDSNYYRNHRLAIDDVIVFRQYGDVLVKRVIGLPGDTLWIYEYSDYSDDKQVISAEDMPSVLDFIDNWPEVGGLHRVSLSQGQVFVMGDNSTDSLDSRDFGPISTGQIIGRICFPHIAGPPINRWTKPIKKARPFNRRVKTSASHDAVKGAIILME